jgi:hypothetical protein
MFLLGIQGLALGNLDSRQEISGMTWWLISGMMRWSPPVTNGIVVCHDEQEKQSSTHNERRQYEGYNNGFGLSKEHF